MYLLCSDMVNKPLSLSAWWTFFGTQCNMALYKFCIVLYYYLFILRIFLPRDAMLQCGLCCWQLSKDWLSDQFQEKTVSINKEVSLLLELLNLQINTRWAKNVLCLRVDNFATVRGRQ